MKFNIEVEWWENEQGKQPTNYTNTLTERAVAIIAERLSRFDNAGDLHAIVNGTHFNGHWELTYDKGATK